MNNDIADQLIAAANEEGEKDELGLFLPKDDTPRCHYEYLVARAFFLNKHLHTRHAGEALFNGHEIVKCTVSDICTLCNWLEYIPRPGVNYIYKRLKELAPYLDENMVAVAPTILWDKEGQRLIETDEPIRTISDW